MQKYGFDDARDVLERASARETAARVAAGSLAKALLAQLGVSVLSHVVALGPARVEGGERPGPDDLEPGRRLGGAVLRPRGRGAHGGGHQGGGQGRRLARRRGRGPRLRRAGGPRQPRALGPPARRAAGPGAHEHPGREARRARRGVRGRDAARLGGPRRHQLGRGLGHLPARHRPGRRDRGRACPPAASSWPGWA